MKKSILSASGPIPIRLEMKQDHQLSKFQQKTGLSKSFVIRRCIDYALERFASEEVNILTFQKK